MGGAPRPVARAMCQRGLLRVASRESHSARKLKRSMRPPTMSAETCRSFFLPKTYRYPVRATTRTSTLRETEPEHLFLLLEFCLLIVIRNEPVAQGPRLRLSIRVLNLVNIFSQAYAQMIARLDR
jgi:hypothetical protein